MLGIKRITKANFCKIEADAKCGLPDNTAFELIQYRNPEEIAALVVHTGDFAGVYRIVKVKGPRWIGDNGYIFERDINAVETITLNTRYDNYGSLDAATARALHFSTLAKKIKLNKIIEHN